jgi:hypothetical protein
MEPTKARFMITAEADDDGRTTGHYVKQMQLEGQDEIYVFPAHAQKLSGHDQLLQSATIKSARKALTTRGTYRNPFIKLTDDLAKTYLDDDGNPSYKGELLEEVKYPQSSISYSSASTVVVKIQSRG